MEYRTTKICRAWNTEHYYEANHQNGLRLNGAVDRNYSDQCNEAVYENSPILMELYILRINTKWIIIPMWNGRCYK